MDFGNFSKKPRNLTPSQTKDRRSWNPLIPNQTGLELKLISPNLSRLVTLQHGITHITVGDRPVDLIVGADEGVLCLQCIRERGHMKGDNVGCLLHLPAVEQSVH